jgi:hypothetical protein
MTFPIIQTFKDSYSHVFNNKLAWLKVGFAPFCIDLLSRLFEFGSDVMEKTSGSADGNPMQILLFIVSMILLTLSVILFWVNGYRYGILNEGGDRWWNFSIDLRTGKLLVFIAGLILSAGFVLGILMFIYDLNEAVAILLGIGCSLIGLYVFFRLSFLIPIISIDGKHALKGSWILLQGNVLRIIGLTIMVFLPIMAAFLFFLLIMFLGFNISIGLGVSVTFLLIPFGVIIYLLSWAVYSKAISLAFQSLTAKPA